MLQCSTVTNIGKFCNFCNRAPAKGKGHRAKGKFISKVADWRELTVMERTKFIELKKIFETLHGPKGCLWDKEQTHKKLIPYLREEAEELISAIKNEDYAHMKEELGDLLIQVMFHSQLASKENKFDVEDVIEGLVKKLKRRHPHVFGRKKVKSAREIVANWNKIKAEEKAGKA